MLIRKKCSLVNDVDFGLSPLALVEGSARYLATADVSSYVGGIKRFDQALHYMWVGEGWAS